MSSGKILTGPRRGDLELKPLGKLFFEQCEKFAEKICQIDSRTDKSETFSSLKQRSVKLAVDLKIRKGISSEDVIAICSANTLDSVVPFVAATFLGAKVCYFDPKLSVRDAKHLFAITEPKIVFAEDSGISLGLVEHSFGDGDHDDATIVVLGKSDKYETLATILDQTDDGDNEGFIRTLLDDVDVEDTALVFFSSGTTGLPKAICKSHSSVLYSAYDLIERNPNITALLHFTTLYWISGVMVLLTSFIGGGYRVLCREFGAKLTFEIIEKYKVSLAVIASNLTYALTRFEDSNNYDTSSLQHLITGGTGLAPLQLQNLRNLFKHCKVLLCYAITEAGGISMFDSNSSSADFLNKKLSSSGSILPETSIKIVDCTTGKLLGTNEKGEILVKSKTLMKCYMKMDSSGAFDEEGFFKTGDVGYFDEDGCVYVVDRIKEMFKYQSWHILPTSLEMVLLEHPAVKEALVFGVPHEEDGHVPAAAVVLLDETCKAEDIAEFFAQRVLDREKLRGGVWIVDQLPRTPTGKLLRNQIRSILFTNK